MHHHHPPHRTERTTHAPPRPRPIHFPPNPPPPSPAAPSAALAEDPNCTSASVHGEATASILTMCSSSLCPLPSSSSGALRRRTGSHIAPWPEKQHPPRLEQGRTLTNADSHHRPPLRVRLVSSEIASRVRLRIRSGAWTRSRHAALHLHPGRVAVCTTLPKSARHL